MTYIYKTKFGAERKRQHIIKTWARYLEMEKRLYIVKYPSGLYHLQDYSNRLLTEIEKKDMYYEF